jgi:hypothetical protein
MNPSTMALLGLNRDGGEVPRLSIPTDTRSIKTPAMMRTPAMSMAANAGVRSAGLNALWVGSSLAGSLAWLSSEWGARTDEPATTVSKVLADTTVKIADLTAPVGFWWRRSWTA